MLFPTCDKRLEKSGEKKKLFSLFLTINFCLFLAHRINKLQHTASVYIYIIYSLNNTFR